MSQLLSLLVTGELILFANHRDIQLVDGGAVPSPNGRLMARNATPEILISNLEDATAIDFLYEDQSIFWTAANFEIKQINLRTSRSPKTTVSRDLLSLDGLAVDWVSRKLYWSDSETNRIEVSTLDGEFRKVLYWEGLDRPGRIALDPENGYMYWTDYGEMPKIEKAGMDGTEETRSVIISKDISWPTGLALDYEMSRIFWVDVKLKSIFSCDFDGGNRRAVIEGTLRQPFSITVSSRNIYWSDWHRNAIHSCNKLTGAGCYVVMEKIYAPMVLQVYSPARQPRGTNMCGDNNGGCSHLCLLSPVSPYFTCACPTGVKLLSDNKTCANGAEKMLFLARRSDLRQISLDTPDYTDVVIPVKNIKHAIALNYDSITGYIYWTDDEERTIQRCFVNGSGQEVVTNTEVIRPEGIAVDWIAQNLYWTDTGTDRIEVARVNGSSRKVLISDGLEEPRALCLDPAKGYMYWTDWGEKKPMIARAYLDGTNRHEIITKGIKWPNGLALDLAKSRLYWGDAIEDNIESANLDGTDRKILVSEKLPHIFGFSVLDEFIYWTDWQSRSIERVNKWTGKNRTSIVDELPDVMGLKAAHITGSGSELSGTNICADNNGNCSHLCLYRPEPLRHVCACPMGLELRADGQTCIVPDAFLLFSSRSDIHRLSLETSYNNQPIPIQGVQKAMAIDFDISDNRIYWTDGELQQISRAFMNGSSLQHMIQFGLDSPEGLAVDWVAHNIYWADTGKNRIEVSRLDGSSRKALVWRELTSPRALALDPPKGYLYWSSWGVKPVLERANLDGTNRGVLISNVGRVQDITIDYIDRRLYWTDISDHSIRSSNLLGGDVRLVAQSQIKHPMGLSQYEDFVFWTDPIRGTIERASKVDGTNRTVLLNKLDVVMDILVYHASRQAGTNACGHYNGGCSHLCLAHPLDDPTNTTHHCACPTHYTLSGDRHTCSAPQHYLLMSTRNSTIRLVYGENNVVDNPEVTLPINGMKNIKALDYDPVEEYIYWVEGRQRVIKRAHDNGTMMTTVISDADNTFQPYDIAVDPYARTIYWTCNIKDVINVTRIDVLKAPIGVIVQSESDFKPRSLVIYPEKGKIFFTNMVKPPKIEQALMDGTERTPLFSSALEHPLSLTIDKQEQKLYWADQRLNRIEIADLTGGNRRVLVDGQVGNPRGLSVYGNFLYWLSKETNQLERIEKMTGNRRLWVRSHIKGLSDLISVEHSVYTSWHPCHASKAPGCSHLCFIGDNDKARCSCPMHLMLKKDKKTCSEPPTCASHEFKCRSGSVQCIPKVWKCDRSPECEDQSDEENCDECSEDQFKCGSGECIARTLLCDGTQRCSDGSDEAGCCVEGKDGRQCPAGQADCDDGKPCPSKASQARGKNSKNYTIAFVAVGVFFVVVVLFVFVCKHKAAGGRRGSAPLVTEEDIMMVKKPLNPAGGPLLLLPGAAGSDSGQGGRLSPHSTALMSRGKSQVTGLSIGSDGSVVGGSSGPPPFYDRNHVTGASSSSSTVTHYPQETLNPPPSPVTDRSVYTAPTGDVYVSLNSLASTAILEQQPMVTGGSISSHLPTSKGRRRNNHRRHHHHHHHHHHIPTQPLLPQSGNGGTTAHPATTTPCSTDVCEDSEPYHHPLNPHHHSHHHHHHHHHHKNRGSMGSSTAVPLHTSTPASNKKHSSSSRMSRSRKASAKKLTYYFNNSGVELNYDSDPYPPPPTPHSHYFSDEVSCPPSPSTERSYFNPYPPPPSPVATSDC
ncbi:low-density lipoprotein receptor-related protein 6 [Elysia marginata]|uniref:Low-density lipoprotein receptor-related protein 6 n=1 Tax=Elysia marginata TaxID=1093978 RepID=A0AAV4GLM0_9GAST|nr:low-density lipoprotein receptor-related protein 6 [Elysia marginata]